MIHISAFADEIAPEPEKQFEVLAQHGIRHIEFRSIYGTNVLDLTDAQHQAFKTLLDQHGVGLSAIGSPIGKIQIGDPFDPHMARFEIAIRLAQFYGTPRIRIFSYYLPREDDPARYRDEVLRRMAAKAKLAEKRGIELVLENERYIYGDTAERVRDVLDSVASAALGHAFDPANYLEVGQSIDEAWEMLRSRTVHFHVKDYDLSSRKNVPAGEGQGKIPELIADAVAHGYHGFCVLEPHLLISELTHGFTGPERFGEAANALKNALDARGIAYDGTAHSV
jgi:sugar phosphate isomerase/epimerase